MSRPRIPLYPSRPHASGRARVKVSGKTIYLGPWGSDESKKKYAELVNRLLANGDEGARIESLTIAQLAEAWRKHADAFYGPGSREPKCMAAAILVVERLFGSTLAKNFDSRCLKAVRSAMVSGSWMTEVEQLKRRQNKSRPDWSKNYTNHQVARLKTIWRWAESEGMVPRGSWEHLRSVRGLTGRQARETKPRAAVEWADVAKVIPVVPPAVAAMIQLQWWTGARPGEIVSMLASEVDDSGDTWFYKPAHHKTEWRGDERTIAIGAEGQRVLAPWLDLVQGNQVVFAAGTNRRPYTVTSYGRAISRGCERAGVDRFTAYQIRHAFKRRITRQFGLDAARAAMGQSSIEATNGYDRQQDVETAANVARQAG